MSVEILQERLKQHQSESWQEEELAMREIYQEVALAALSRTNFFEKASFHGGTALRILYGLGRFSEDLDFTLKKPDKEFHLQTYIKALQEEFRLFGIPVALQDLSKEAMMVQKLFLKQESGGMLLKSQHTPRDRRPAKIRIKIEVDTNPPIGARDEIKYLDFPFAFAIGIQDLPSLFAGKSHALLCRQYMKGRDWYDFLWYVARKTPINFKYLTHACEQNGPWKGSKLAIAQEWYLQEMEKKIRSVDWNEARQEVSRFLKKEEISTLSLWKLDFFLDRLHKLGSYL